MKKRWIALLLTLSMLFSFGACNDTQGNSGQADSDEAEVRTFAEWTEAELFQDIPAMIVAGTKIGEAVDYGGKDYVLDVSGTDLEDYQSYLQLLEENGFTRYVDNGTEGLDGAVYTCTFTKDTLVLTVTQLAKCSKTYISACDGLALSPNLHYDDSYVADNEEGAQTTLHMLELYDNGNSFLIRLKNGHFIMNDGGNPEDCLYLLDYMESLAPEGEKPVVEAWFISHGHADHVGWLNTMMSEVENIDRVAVEAFYFSEPSAALMAAISDTGNVSKFIMNYKFLRNSEGKAPKLYRPQTGQRYYFDDVTVDIVFTQEQHCVENYHGALNDSSTWLMYTIEGQKFLVCGDAEWGSVKAVMRTYDADYFDLDVFAVFHHGINVYNDFTDYCTLKTVLYTDYRCGSLYEVNATHKHEEENTYLINSSEEAIAWGNGTVVLTFPYEVGTAKIMPSIAGVYNPKDHEYLTPRAEEYETYIRNQKE